MQIYFTFTINIKALNFYVTHCSYVNDNIVSKCVLSETEILYHCLIIPLMLKSALNPIDIVLAIIFAYKY